MELVKDFKGLAMVSGYDSGLYNELYKEWNKASFKPKKKSIRSGEVTEVIWFNYEL